MLLLPPPPKPDPHFNPAFDGWFWDRFVREESLPRGKYFRHKAKKYRNELSAIDVFGSRFKGRLTKRKVYASRNNKLVYLETVTERHKPASYYCPDEFWKALEHK